MKANVKIFPLRAISIGIMVAALVVLFTSICTDEWYHVKTNQSKKYNGLWNHCVQMDGQRAVCTFLVGWQAISVDTMTSIRGFFALAVLFLLGAIIYPPFYKQMTTGVVKLEFMAILCLIGTACSFLGMIIMTHEVHSKVENSKFGYSYYVGWAGTCTSAVGAVLAALSTRDDIYIDQGLQ